MRYTLCMNKKQIVTVPDSRLRQRSKRVGVITDETKAIAEQMSQATLEWEATRQSEVGVALAAVQIGELERIVVIRSNPDDKRDRSFETFINPEIVKYEGDPVEEPEGCLSIPDTYGVVPRYPRIRIKALDLNGRTIRMKIDGFLARVLQHEVDHLHGKLFVDYVVEDNFYKIMDNGKFDSISTEEIDQARVLWRC